MAATSELEFEDMLFARVPSDEPRPPAKVVPGPALQLGQPAKRQEHARAGRCQLSALTASVQSMSLVIDDDAAPASGGEFSSGVAMCTKSDGIRAAPQLCRPPFFS